jgi:hypothetical protein
MPNVKHKQLIKYNSKFDNELLLVEVVSVEQHFIVKVLGEKESIFRTSAEAYEYAKHKNSTFYTSN